METTLPRGVIDGKTPVNYINIRWTKRGKILHKLTLQMDLDIEKIRKRIKELTPSSGWSTVESDADQDLETLKRKLIELEAEIGRREVEKWVRERESVVKRRGGDESERKSSTKDGE